MTAADWVPKEVSKRLARMDSTFARCWIARCGWGARAAGDAGLDFALTFAGAAFLLLMDVGFLDAVFCGAALDLFFGAVLTGLMLVLPTVCA
jgi:hypothetical protein